MTDTKLIDLQHHADTLQAVHDALADNTKILSDNTLRDLIGQSSITSPVRITKADD
jgi:hypothetical protein